MLSVLSQLIAHELRYLAESGRQNATLIPHTWSYSDCHQIRIRCNSKWRHTSLSEPSTLACAFEQFLEPRHLPDVPAKVIPRIWHHCFTQCGQATIPALTDEISRHILARQESLAPATYNRRLAALRSFPGGSAIRDGMADRCSQE